jgi:hypothetical protein
MKTSVDNINKILVDMSADHPGDIIADILHWCNAYNEDFENLMKLGQDYYMNEIKGGE